MQAPTIISVIETGLEVEARIHEALICEAGLHAQVRVINKDPFLSNIERRLVQPR